MSNYDLSAYPLFRSVIDGQDARPKSKRCFVVSPIDDSNAGVRQHADTLWKYVIQPALLDTDYAARRVEPHDGAIMVGQSTIDALLDDDLIIAVLSYRNAHVFYEAALAQASARPLILMIADGQNLSFDPRGAKVLTYSLDTDSVVSAVNVTRLQAMIREIEGASAPIQQGFRPGAAALNGGGDSGATVFERSPQFTYDQRLNMVREARTRIDIMGLANLALAMHPDAVEVVRARAGQGVEFRILQCAPSNPGLVSLVGSRDGHNLDAVRHEIDAAADAWKRIIDLPDLDLSITVRRAQTSLPLASALITDRAVVATPYLHSRTTTESPTLYAQAGSPYHRAMAQEFDTLWSEAVTVFRAEPRPVRLAVTHTDTPLLLEAVRAHPALPNHAAAHATHSGRSGSVTGLRGFSLIRGIGHSS